MSQSFPFAYIRKQIVPIEQAVVPIQCKAIQYGLGCFSGMRGSWNEEANNLFLFRLQDHFLRLKEGAKILGMTLDFTPESFQQTVVDLIKKNQCKEDIYIRTTLYCGATTLTPRFKNPDDDVAIYVSSLKDYFDPNKGLNVCVSSWSRVEDSAMSSKAKVTGAYVNSALAKTEALDNGYDEAIFLNKDGNVCEASSANIFGVKDGVVYTPPLSSNNLNGITRRTIVYLFKEIMKIDIREEDFDRSTLYGFDEMFFTGTAAKVTPVASVDKRLIGDGQIGPMTKQIQEVFSNVTLGKLPKFSRWLTQIY